MVTYVERMADETAQGILKLKDLECHFNWEPMDVSTKMGELKTTIEKTEKKMRRHPQNTIAHRCTLAYLLNIGDDGDYLKAKDLLDGKDGDPPEKEQLQVAGRWFDCEFVVKANRLMLDHLNLGKKENESEDLRRELTELSELWKSDKTKASVYAVKGITFNCFGPEKYEESKKAYEKALSYEHISGSCPNVPTDWQRFELKWGVGFATARIGRFNDGYWYKPTEEELISWYEAYDLAKKLGVQDPEFYASFAETIMHLDDKRFLCEELINQSHELVRKLSDEKKADNNNVYAIMLKVFWKFRDVDKVDQVYEEGKNFFVDSPTFLLAYLQSVADNEKAIRLLEKMLTKIGKYNHHSFDLEYIKRQVSSSEDDILKQYEDLVDSYKSRKKWKKDIGMILLNKSLYLLDKERPKEAFEALLEGKNEYPDLFIKKFYYKKYRRELQKDKEKEKLAWFLDNFGEKNDSVSPEEIVRLFSCTINECRENLESAVSVKRIQFAYKHLGKHYMRHKNYAEARNQYSNLVNNIKEKESYASAIIEDEKSTIDDLLSCLDLRTPENIHVIERILSKMEYDKTKSTARSYLLDLDKDFGEVFNNGDLFFSRKKYEICAKIHCVIDDPFYSLARSEKSKISQRISGYLELNEDSSSTDSTQIDREKLWRTSRLDATELKWKLDPIYKQPSQDNVKIEIKLCNNIVQTLNDSKSELDRCFRNRFKNHSNKKLYYPHGFNAIKKEPNEDKMKEMETRVGKILQNSVGPYSEYEKRLEEAFKYIDKKDFKDIKTNKDFENEFKFFVNREHYICTKQAAWLLRWHYLVNEEKHNLEMKVKELEEVLKKDCDTVGIKPVLTAYDVAHLAAEFAEQTRIVLEPPKTTSPKSK